ncbi:MAG: Flavin reductase domain protein FMN-binding [uncultured Sulfurovum sp.]|uniref:Flavin reductase domain protein FMN-binding n=1 Tax=uncultured Sulfurovum sp. TaxID=269237 RepID=A0A6S6U9I9_9BACT|nr:MAG: Flavin reductase domain protein FMN-binding [uncultured Sulfurovum sp.]
MFNTYDTLEQATHAQQRVTALLACGNNLMPVSWHMPVSKSPFRYAVAVREENYTHQLLEQNGSFMLNFLPFEYYEVVALMGNIHGDKEDKLALSQLEIEKKDRHANPLLSASDFVYECVVCDTYKNGDHTIFITDVKAIHVNEKQSEKPMFFSGRGRYATIAETVCVNKKNLQGV